MRDKLVIIFLILVMIFLGTIPVSANPIDDLKQFQKLSNLQKVSDMNSVTMTSSNFNDPFGNTVVQPISTYSTFPTNPFNTIDSSLSDPMRQLKYTTEFNSVSAPLLTVQRTSTSGLFSSAYPEYSTAISTTGTIIGSMTSIYSLYDSTYDQIGYSTQILSPPALNPVKYETTNFGPYGMYGSQAIGKDTIGNDQFSKLTSDEFYTTTNSIDHFNTQQTTFNDFALPYTPGVTVSGTRIETDSFHTPLQSGIGGLQMSHLTTNYPSFGYDPTTDVGTRSITQNMQYNIQTNPGISDTTSSLTNHNSIYDPITFTNPNSLTNSQSWDINSIYDPITFTNPNSLNYDTSWNNPTYNSWNTYNSLNNPTTSLNTYYPNSLTNYNYQSWNY